MVVRDRVTAVVDGDFVVFLIGMRINYWRKPAAWLPVVRAMPRMLAELKREPALGLLDAGAYFSGRNLFTIQYWRSFEALHAYAHAADRVHRPAWAAFNRAVGSGGDVGIWHETYLVRAGEYETVYNNMPPFGLARAGTAVPARDRRSSAKGRLGRASELGADRDPVVAAENSGVVD